MSPQQKLASTAAGCGYGRLLYAVQAMPANLSPEYRKVEQAFHAAHEARQRLVCMKEMLRTIRRHKAATEHVGADIKSQIAQTWPAHSVRIRASRASTLPTGIVIGPFPPTTRETCYRGRCRGAVCEVRLK